ncbi:acyl carrier protein [Thermobrachium celere]|uniref:Acyl carrier protein n=1 Tax=Thermobrachium celere DSM 8682 TaxID=941824 RepID=R7RU65_9CLOT|nr:acyl carrier protein [Thermobrachium celere]CDF58830.1 Acyl carrier protein [Thermobrachium celere DSM 8682]
MFEKIRNIIAEQLNLDESEITEATTFEELGVDSLDLFQILISLEDEFGVEIPNEDAENIKTVKDVVDYIKERIGDE